MWVGWWQCYIVLLRLYNYPKCISSLNICNAINKRTYCQWWTLGIWEIKKQVENSDWELNGIAITLPLMMMMMIDSATAATDPWWKHEMRPHISQLSVFLVKPPLADRTAASCGFLKMWVVWWRCCLAKKNKKTKHCYMFQRFCKIGYFLLMVVGMGF